MKGLLTTRTQKLRQFSPATFFVSGLFYVLAVGMVEALAPSRLSFTLFYVLGSVFVGWGGR